MDITKYTTFDETGIELKFNYGRMINDALKKYPVLGKWKTTVLRGDTEFNEVDGGYYIKNTEQQPNPFVTDGIAYVNYINNNDQSWKKLTLAVDIEDSTFFIMYDKYEKNIYLYLNANTLDDDKMKKIEQLCENIVDVC